MSMSTEIRKTLVKRKTETVKTEDRMEGEKRKSSLPGDNSGSKIESQRKTIATGQIKEEAHQSTRKTMEQHADSKHLNHKDHDEKRPSDELGGVRKTIAKGADISETSLLFHEAEKQDEMKSHPKSKSMMMKRKTEAEGEARKTMAVAEDEHQSPLAGEHSVLKDEEGKETKKSLASAIATTTTSKARCSGDESTLTIKSGTTLTDKSGTTALDDSPPGDTKTSVADDEDDKSSSGVRKSLRKSIATGPVKLSYASLHITRKTLGQHPELMHLHDDNHHGEKRPSDEVGELRVIVRGMDTSETSLLHEEEEEYEAETHTKSKSMMKRKTEIDGDGRRSTTVGRDKRESTHTADGSVSKDEEGKEKRESLTASPIHHHHHHHHHHQHKPKCSGDDSTLTEILGPVTGSPPASPTDSMLLANEEMEGEGEMEGDVTAASSFQITFRPSALMRMSVDSQEYALRHGAHIAGQDREEDLEFEKQEPYKTESEINMELKKQHERHTLLEQESVVRETLIVWENISRYIIRKMQEGIGVRISGLGTFTQAMLPNHLIMQRKESDKYTLRRLRKFPIFKICPHVKEMCGLGEENYLYQANLPVVCLSTAGVAAEAKLPRGLVQGIITETLIAFSRGVSTNKDVEFPFPYIGKMYVKDRKVYMFFYRRFCEGLSFDFSQQMTMISSVILGQMTPLHYHRPAQEVKSVFHYDQMNQVEDKMRTRTLAYASGDLIRDDAEDRCKFLQKLFTHSNLPFDCSCCVKNNNNNAKKSMGEEANGSEDTEDTAPNDFLCEFSKNYDRIERACCMQPGGFSFQQPDGSTFTPEPLYRTAKTGNPVLDRLTDDKCLLHQALSCWMKRNFLQSLGPDVMAQHFDRGYFRRIGEARRRTFLEAQPLSSSYVESEVASDAFSHEELEKKSRESAFYKRLEACLIALEQAEEQEEEEEESEKSISAHYISEEGEMSESTGDKGDMRKSKRYNNFEVYSGLYYNLLDNDRERRNESDFNLLSKTPSTLSPGGSPTIRSKTPSTLSTTSTPSSTVCWEQPLSTFIKQPIENVEPPPTPTTTPAQQPFPSI